MRVEGHILLRCDVGPFFRSQQSFTSLVGPTNAGESGGGYPDGGGEEGEREVVTRPDGVGTSSGGATGNVDRVSLSMTEEAQQAFLSRLLLMLGSFVVLCLIAF